MKKPSIAEDREVAYAKLNLALHVRKRLPNGYHELNTLFAFLDQGDEISVSQSDNLSLTTSGLFADHLDADGNLVVEAANILREAYDITNGAQLNLHKNLPVSSGIGGGSADAAATLRLLNRFWNLDLSQDVLIELAKPLGADVPACISSIASIGRGIGQDLEPIEINDLSGAKVLLVNPLTPISTAAIFGKWDGVDRGSLDFNTMSEALISGRNDLEPIAAAMENSISLILSGLNDTDPIAAKMSGSGATCFGIYDSDGKMKAAKATIETSFNNIWTMTGQLR